MQWTSKRRRYPSDGWWSRPLSICSERWLYDASRNFSGLLAGAYSFTVKDVNGCTATVSTTLTTQSSFSPSVASQQTVACFGAATGSISLTTTGTTVGPVQYAINSGAFSTNNTFSGLSAGAYTITAQDNLCTYTIPVSLTQPSGLMVMTAVNQSVSCFNGTNGAISVAGTGGTPTYQYSADGVTYQSASGFTGLGAGNYKYWVKDANGCVATSAIQTLLQPTALEVTIIDRNDVRCFGEATGDLTVRASGGTTPYMYSRTNTNFSSSNQFLGLSASTYIIQVRDANGCPASLSTTIGQPTVLQGGLSNLQPVTCAGGSDGAFSLSATGGTEPYRFSRDNTTFGSTNSFTGLIEGSYTLFVRDDHGCSLSVTGTVSYQSKLLLSTASVKPVACYGAATGDLTVSDTGSTAVGPTLYSIDGSSIYGFESGQLHDLPERQCMPG